MEQHSGGRIPLSLVALICMIAPAHGQETKPPRAEPKPARSRDRATELLRREAEAAIAEREKVFAKIKELAPAPPVADARLRVAGGVWMVRPFIMVEPLPAPRNDDENDVIAPPPRFVVARGTFDQYILVSTGNRDSRAYLESILTRRVEAIDRQRHLTPDQRKKLVLAGRGDIKRLLDQIEDERKQFEQKRSDLQGCQRFLQGLEPLWATMRQGPFEEGSLFAKTLTCVSKTR